jgi:predicted solute-binding protein
MKSRLAVPDAVFVKPLLFGLEKDSSPFELVFDIPARNALKLSERSEGIRSAFLSPIDYARHGAEYCLVPKICVASSLKSNTIQLFLNADVRNIERIAIDIRYTSEIILAKIIIAEKYRNQKTHHDLQFIPMMPDLDAMLAKADAALIVNDIPKFYSDIFSLDLVEEWNDLTDLPYVHGFWVSREEELIELEAQALITAKEQGVSLRKEIIHSVAQQKNISIAELERYLSLFTFEMGSVEEESLSEFMHYAFFYGVIGDIPDIRFFDISDENFLKN